MLLGQLISKRCGEPTVDLDPGDTDLYHHDETPRTISRGRPLQTDVVPH